MLRWFTMLSVRPLSCRMLFSTVLRRTSERWTGVIMPVTQLSTRRPLEGGLRSSRCCWNMALMSIVAPRMGQGEASWCMLLESWFVVSWIFKHVISHLSATVCVTSVAYFKVENRLQLYNWDTMIFPYPFNSLLNSLNPYSWIWSHGIKSHIE